jgi:hypothetical protein
MRGRFDKGFLGNIEAEDNNNVYGIDQSVSYLSKNLNNGIHPLPNYANIRANLPSYSIPKAQRFDSGLNAKVPGPGAYYIMDGLFNLSNEHISSSTTKYIYM